MRKTIFFLKLSLQKMAKIVKAPENYLLYLFISNFKWNERRRRGLQLSAAAGTNTNELGVSLYRSLFYQERNLEVYIKFFIY